MCVNWVALNSVKGLGPVKFQQLLKIFESPENVFNASAEDLRRAVSISASAISAIKKRNIVDDAKREVEKAQKTGVKILTLADNDYPLLLKEIFAPPPVLYVRGNIKVLSKRSVAVVGTRNTSSYGRSATKAIVKEFPANNIVVVSGLALGVDAIAHQTTLDVDGFTVAVLAGGVDKPTPVTNKKIADRIVETGALVSEFPLGTPSESYNFPRRNRIISGLSFATVVVEAGKKSGTLITANYALQQGRDVFAVPGSIFSDKSEGCNRLIKQGAIPLQSGLDVVNSINLASNGSKDLFATEPNVVVQAAKELLNGPEQDLLDVLGDNSMRIDQLMESTGKDMGELFNILLNLELKGYVCQVAGQQYVKAEVDLAVYGATE